MSYGLYISAEGAHVQNARLDVIANNLANVDTVGFKRELAVFQARYAEAIQQGQASPGSGTINDLGGGVMVRETNTDFSTGPLKTTGLPTDVAIQGEGFFAVRRGNETLLTRAGNFRLTARGELVTQNGDPVLSEGGGPMLVQRPNEPWQVNASGEIAQGNDVQRLAIVRPRSPGDLARVGENLFRPLAPTEPVAAANRNVAGGHLEMSSVQPTSEMVEMIETSRALECNLNLMQTHDRLLTGLFSRALKA